MKQVGGLWLPDHEQHFLEWMQAPKNKHVIDGKLTYQWRKQQFAMEAVRSWRTAVDVGAHCGLWSMHLVKRFANVIAFEPVADHRACWEKNVRPNVADGHIADLVPMALGAKAGRVRMETTPGSSGDTRVAGAGEIEMRTLDDFAIPDCDFLKIDCEGYELYVLQGAVETLKRCKPTIIVEQKPRVIRAAGFARAEAVEFLQALGASLVLHYSGDYIMRWER